MADISPISTSEMWTQPCIQSLTVNREGGGGERSLWEAVNTHKDNNANNKRNDESDVHWPSSLV